MLSESAIGALFDIRDNILLAQQFVADLDERAFSASRLRFYAATRALEIISEASRRLPKALKDRHPAIGWDEIAGAGNVYRHDYEDVRERRLWSTVHKDLPLLLSVVEDELCARGE